MKKSVKRIVCATLATMMVGSVSLEGILRMTAQQADQTQANTNTQAKFTNVTGQFDTSAIREANFNSSVLKGQNEYETRTVIVSLAGDSLVDSATLDVSSYMNTLAGKQAANAIKKTQNEFLRALSDAGVDYSLQMRYNAIDNAVAIDIDTKYVSGIKQMAGVDSVVIANTYMQPQTVSSNSSNLVATTNETNVYATGIYDSSAYADTYSGQGTTVAVLDTGLDYTHPAFQGFKSQKGEDQARWKTSGAIQEIFDAKDMAAENTSTAAEVFVSKKVPFAYDYADKDADVYPSYSNHGTHVAGIVGGYDTNGYTDKDGVHHDEHFVGVAPDAQLVICKVFTDNLDSEELGGAEAENILAALDDCVKLGVDVINMSLGTTAGFSTTDDGDDEGEYLNRVYEDIKAAGISLICAASNDYSSGYGGVFGTNLTSNPDSATIGSPASYAAALAVASISGQQSKYFMASEKGKDNTTPVFYEEASDENSNPYDFTEELLGAGVTTGTLEYVVIPGIGQTADYSTSIKTKVKGRIALVERGDSTFLDKVETASKMGAKAIIVYNNVAGKIRMSLGEIQDEYRIPAVSITMSAGEAMVKAAGSDLIGQVSFNTEQYLAGPFMSDFSSWGPTPDLKLKPEITAHGGEITSTVPGGYDEQSGTSMASPNMAGFAALVRSYVKNEMSAEVAAMMSAHSVAESVAINRLVNQLTMSTATTAKDEDGLPYSPRQQGAGLASLDNILSATKTQAYLYTNNEVNDYRPKIELGDDPEKLGKYTLEFSVKNFGASALTFGTALTVMTETPAIDKLAVAEQAHLFDDVAAVWYVNGSPLTAETFLVPANTSATIKVEIQLSDADKNYIDDNFQNGMYVEGFAKLTTPEAAQCDLTLPFLGFFGDWTAAPMLDYSAFEIADFEQDTSIPDEEKPQASVYATQPFSTYYNEDYILPMGGYVYLLDENDTPMYANEEYCSVSRYNEYISADGVGNYMTSTGIRAVYAGLLRNARKVEYRMYDAYTGELILEDTINRVGKAYSGGGSSRPANVELKMTPDEYGLAANGKYKMEFDFFLDYGDQSQVAEGNTFEFSFYVDYEAPVLENAGIRYETTNVNNKEKSLVYLDLSIYDNHYPQSVMLCYGDEDDKGQEILVLATEYITPVRNPVKNGTSTVSIDITDIYKEHRDNLYVQLDDYSLNNCVYYLEALEGQSDYLPDTFSLAEGEDNITLDIYGTHKVALDYEGSAKLGNFVWESRTPDIVAVKEGEIVGLKEGTGSVTVTNGKGVTRRIQVTVTGTQQPIKLSGVSFGLVETYTQALTKAAGMVTVNAGEEFTLEVIGEPWYYPMDTLDITWESSNAKFATVTQEGVVKTLAEGRSQIKASIAGTAYSAYVILDVEDEFTVANFTLTDYHGVGYNEQVTIGGKTVNVLRIPDDMNIMYIGEEAFLDNDNIEILIIPKTVREINRRAFQNCTALKEVYFDEMTAQPIADSDISLLFNDVFNGCYNLEKVDLTNTKTFTIGANCFANCVKLKEVVAMNKISTMHDSAFSNCVALEHADLTGLHMSGSNVFNGCSALATIATDKFTAIGPNMFRGCNKIESVTLNTPKIGAGAFANCKGLQSVTFSQGTNSDLLFDIGANAFANCSNLTSVDFNDVTVRSIGDLAFANTKLTSFAIPNGLVSMGGDILKGSPVTQVSFAADFDVNSLTLTGLPFNGLTIDITAASNHYTLEDGVLYNKAQTKLYMVTAAATATAFHVPASVTEIAPYAFVGSSFTKVTIPASVTEIGEGAFAKSALQQIVFNGSSLTELKADTFSGSALQSVVIPASVTKLGDAAFANTPLVSVTFAPNSLLTTLGDGVFADCRMLTSIALPEDITSMGSYTFENCLLLKTVEMPKVKTLGAYTFYGASNLQEVTFHAEAETAGTYTFMGTPVKKVTLGNATTKLEDGQRIFMEGYIGYSDYEWVGGVFYGCSKLEEVVMENVTSVGSFAFANCTKLNLDMTSLQHIGERAFYNCNAMQTLSLANAQTIGDKAFAVENGGNSAGGALQLNAKSIGAQAFYGTAITGVALGENVQVIGDGAFANAKKLAIITVDNNNQAFFAEDNVLYRNFVSEREANGEAKTYTNGVYELVAYPAAKQAANGEYAVKVGTVSVQAYAFHGLVDGSVQKVSLPYSVKKIGDSAFYQSAIKEYVFASMQAPALESAFRKEVADHADANGSIYKGLYYRNFETYIADYVDITRFTQNEMYTSTSKLIIHYPTNAKGYDNYLYASYFGEKKLTPVAMEDYTRETQEKIAALPAASEISTWTTSNTSKAHVESVSAAVKEARIYLNNIKDETQLTFLGAEPAAKLAEVEVALRAVKKAFGIVVNVTMYEASGEYKKNYIDGETFDPTGLVVTAIYDDGSTEVIGLDEFTQKTTGALSVYTKQVRYVHKVTGKDLRIRVEVTAVAEEQPGGTQTPDTPENPDSSSSPDSSTPPTTDTKPNGNGWVVVVAIVGGVLVLGGGAVATIVICKKKGLLKGKANANEETVVVEETEEPAQAEEGKTQESEQQKADDGEEDNA